MQTHVSVTVAPRDDASLKLLVPVGLPTPHQMPVHFDVAGGKYALTGETSTGQIVAVVTPLPGRPVEVSYRYADGGPGYPESIFTPHRNKFPRAAEPLVFDAINIAETQPDGHAAIQALVNSCAEKFRYGHADMRFNDGCDEVPYLACGLTEGSCVDINTYLIASLRAAGFEAGYLTGYFFPKEKNGTCEDAHCWVVTRHDGIVLEWDIAHHLKMGTREITSGLTPKPGDRVALAHSMGLRFPELGIDCEKLISEPGWVSDDGRLQPGERTISRVIGDSAAAA